MRRATIALVGALTSCGPGPPSMAWLPESAAVLRCTVVGRNRMPPLLLGLPAPDPPSGLLARAMDPMALDGLGFERDRVACAVMIAPESARIDAVRDTTLALARAADAADASALRAGGRCACESARVAGVRELLAICEGEPTDRACEADDAEEVAAAAVPLRDAIASAALPRTHWRLVGRTDRPGWLAERLEQLIDRHPGGSTIIRRGEAVPSRDNDELLRRLLDEPGVVAVVRQDSGRALLVVRELDAELVLDHFALPPLGRRFAHLAAALDDAAQGEVIAALAAPTTRGSPALDPVEGNLVEIDRIGLELVDAALAAAVAVGGPAAPTVDAARPTVLVDRTIVQAPFGADGAVLRVRMVLSEAGAAWASGLLDAPMPGGAFDMGLGDPRASEPAPDGGPFVLHDRAIERVMVDGIHRLPEIVDVLARAPSATVTGTTTAWRIDVAGDLGGVPLERLQLEAVREQLTSRPYRIELGFDAARSSITIDARPR